MKPFVQSVTVEGKDVQRVIFDRLSPAIEGEPLAHAILSMLTFSIMLMKPDIEIEQLQDIVMSTSEHIIMHLSPVGEAN